MANGRKAQKGATPRKQWPAEGDAGDGGGPSSNEDLVSIVRGLAAAVAEHNLSELVVDTPEVTFTLRRGVAGASGVAMPVMHAAPMAGSMPMPVMHAPPMSAHGAAAMPSHSAAIAAAAPAYNAAAPVVEDKGHQVTSPFVGTFYRKPNPDSSDYVKLGDKVKKGQVLCIVEAMKLMNEIEADIDGTITAILAEDGTSVEYGQALFKITP
jgi:acetyl-CoA carboxylase biotin carboxyl carrier protein